MIKVKCIVNAKVLLVQKWALVLTSLIMGSISNKKKLLALLIAVVLLGATTNVDVLDAQSDDSSFLVRTLEGHTSLVDEVAVTPDGTKAISASWDKTLKVWDIESGVELRTLEGHTDAVFEVAVTPDGKAISVSWDKTLKVWDIESGSESTPTPTPPTEQQPSGCLLATTAFGSELSPQVQFLRDFRDQKIMNTLTGSSFMQVFNAWYYSFSPYVADYERGQPWLQHTVKTSIYPLIGILQTSEKANSSIDGEYGAVVAGFVASFMIGALYFWPFAISVRRVRTNRFNYKLALSMIAAVFVGIISSLAAGNEYALMASTSLFVLMLVSVSAVLSAKLIVTVFHTAGNMIARGETLLIHIKN